MKKGQRGKGRGQQAGQVGVQVQQAEGRGGTAGWPGRGPMRFCIMRHHRPPPPTIETTTKTTYTRPDGEGHGEAAWIEDVTVNDVRID